MDTTEYLSLFAILVIFISGFTQGMTSFGFSLLALPLMTMILPIQVVVPLLMIFSLVLNSMILVKMHSYVQIKRIGILVTGGLIGTPIGVHGLLWMSESILKIIVGVLIIIVATVNLSGKKIPIRSSKRTLFPIGLLSGFFSGSVSLGGPPIVLFLNNQGVEKQSFRGNLTMYFWILNIFSIPSYFMSGLITEPVIGYTITLLPSLILGTALGMFAGNRLNDGLFRKVSLVLITAMGFLAFYSGMA